VNPLFLCGIKKYLFNIRDVLCNDCDINMMCRVDVSSPEIADRTYDNIIIGYCRNVKKEFVHGIVIVVQGWCIIPSVS
jgi:hypothetical protein